MNIVYLVKYGEIFTKGNNRNLFIERLIKNIREKIRVLGRFKVVKESGRIILEPQEEIDELKLEYFLSQIFGVTGIAKAVRFPNKDFENIKEESLAYINQYLNDGTNKTFKVEAKRADKNYEPNSPEICRRIGAHLLENCSFLSVNVNHPDFVLTIEVRGEVYIFTTVAKCAGGMPSGTNGKALLLLSGGIDSPVAGYMIGKRGALVEGVYFDSPPYTSELAKNKVITLAKKVAEYIPGFRLNIVSFTDIQLLIREKCPLEELTIIMRMLMMKISERIAVQIDAQVLVTGESIGQVASQTMHSLVVTDSAVDLPILRPLIGFDKEEIIQIAHKIGTYETSILPYEDCCTLFVARHPVTKPKKEIILKSMEKLEDIEEWIGKAVEATEIVYF